MTFGIIPMTNARFIDFEGIKIRIADDGYFYTYELYKALGGRHCTKERKERLVNAVVQKICYDNKLKHDNNKGV